MAFGDDVIGRAVRIPTAALKELVEVLSHTRA